MKTKFSKSIIFSALMLAAFSLITAVMIALTNKATAPIIEENEHKFLMQSLSAVMPINTYDNDVITDSFSVNNSLLGKEDAVIYPAYKNSQAAGAVITSVATNGYNGKIKLIVGVNFEGVIHAVRVVAHKETPGLGDPIEITRSNWITQFNERSLKQPMQEDWLVKKDGGQFDQLTGATITPRAVVEATKNALVFYQEQREMIFSENTANKLEDKTHE